MPHAHATVGWFSFGRVLAPALVLGLIPLGAAVAQPLQPYPCYVRVTRDNLDISAWRIKPLVRLTAAKGTVFEVFHIEGDRAHLRDSNWYWVTLPENAAGARAAGWLRGSDVELVPAPETAGASRAGLTGASMAPPVTPVSSARSEASPMAGPEPAPAVTASATRPVIADVVLHFPFDRSDLTPEARNTLGSALALPDAVSKGMVVALEGYADWLGPDGYNERLGLARAETVRRYLADQLRIPTSRISVVSYGESNPAAPNTTKAGRASNRRVVIKVG